MKLQNLLAIVLTGAIPVTALPTQAAIRPAAFSGTLETGAPVEIRHSEGGLSGLSAAIAGNGLRSGWIAGSRHAGDLSVAPGTPRDSTDTGAHDGTKSRSWLMLLAGIGLVAVMIERFKRRRI